MALPADFSKIFASTATGGITPPSDLNYAKGWEWIGANPPEKNDFNYLQNLSDLKSQYLYNYLTTASNAASRTIGVGTNQVPDMSSFTSAKTTNGWQRLPGGLIIQWGQTPVFASEQNTSVVFPIAFPTGFLIAFSTYANTTGDPTANAATFVGQIRTSGNASIFIRNLGPQAAQYNWLAIGS